MKRMVYAVCACSWLGQLPTRAKCPACGLSHYDRISAERAAMLEILAMRPAPLAEKPMMRRALLKLGLATPVTQRRQPGGNGTRRPPPQLFAITPRGERALAAYRDLAAMQHADNERQTEHEQQLRRSIAAEAAARHADLPG